MARSRRQTGFTIVELLIVIVVIAILAAITIVAYNGIQNRAKQSAAQSRLTQANKKIMTFYVTNSDRYPADLAEAEVDNTDNGLQYSVDNNSSPKSYGITSTNGTFSYYISSTNSSPTSGGYPGHGQNGVAAITNLIANPKCAINSTGYASGAGTAGVAAVSRVSGLGAMTPGVTTACRATWTTAPSTPNVAIYAAMTNPVTAGKTYTGMVYGRTSWASNTSARIDWINSSSGTISVIAGTAAAQGVNTWGIRYITAVAPAGAVRAYLHYRQDTGTAPSVGSTMDTTALMLTEGSTQYSYADGDSTNWAWSDVANNSQSSGPPN